MNKRNFINKSYKDKLRAAYTMLMFLVLIFLITFLYYQMNKTVKPIIGEMGVHNIDSEAQYFGQRFYNQSNTVELLSNTEAFKTGDLSGIKREIDNQMQRYGDLFISMKFKAITGEEYDNNPRNINTSDNYEKELLTTDDITPLTKTAYNDKLSEYISIVGSKVTNDNGNIVGTLIINSQVKKIISLVEKKEISQLGEMMVFDSLGNVIVQPNIGKMQISNVADFKKQIKNKSSGQIKISNLKGESINFIYSKIPSTQDLYLAMVIEHKDFSNAIKVLMLILLIGGTFACTFIFVFAHKMANFITKPLTRMVEIIQNSDGTNFIEIPKDLKDSKDEIGILANTIDDMARNIRNNLSRLNSEIKERQKAQQNLMILNDKLECRVEERTKELTEASLAKSQFLANMSHEIRTPMNAIMGLTHLIGQSDLNDFQKNYVSKIEGSSNTLLRIINDILDFSKIEAGKIEIEHIKFNLDKVMENISNLYAISATNKGIDINFDTGEAVPDILIGDPLRLEQIICNLTTNAIKFTKSGEVNVMVRVADDKENSIKLHFSVTDTGIGLTKEQIKRLFTAFTQADSSMTRKYGGTGLGLVISKQLVELMNGEIWVESEYGEGACFQFTVEFDKAIDETKTSYLDYPELRGKRVLVVDHNKTSLMILKRMLSSFSLEVTALGDPYKAIELFEKESFDLLIIDFNLPELSGIDFYKRLVANTENNVPKTIFVSAIGRESYYNQVNQLGVKNFLLKPINQSLMFDSVMNALNGTPISKTYKDDSEKGKLKFKPILSDRNILLVEDNEINQLVAREILEDVGIYVSIANNGQEAINHIRANKFDLVLMDVQMPIMDGYEATEIIRKNYSSSQLPVIAMTANALKGDREKSISSGMNDYISKPINPEVLYETLVKWLHSSSIINTLKPIVETLNNNNNNEILDIGAALLRLGNKQEFYMDLLRRYKGSYNNLIEELSEIMANKKKDETKRFIHSLKSVTGHIGAMKLNNFIIEFEKQYESYDEKAIAENLIMLSSLNEELLKSITKILLFDEPQEKFSSVDFQVFGALEKLLVVLKKSRAKEIKECINYLVTNIEDSSYMTEINEIKVLIERFRFKEAIVIVEKLLKITREGNNG